MWQYCLKVLLSALVIVAISAIAKRSTFWAAALASLPLTSLLALVWLYLDTQDATRIASLSYGIFWLVLPSLLLFLLLPMLLRHGVNFWLALLAACIATALAYWGVVKVLGLAGVKW